MQYEGVAKPIRSAAHEVAVAEALSSPAVSVVFKARIVFEMLMSTAKELLTTLSEDHCLLDAEEPVTDDRAGELRVLGRHKVGVGSIGALCRELEHLWSEGGDDPWHARAALFGHHGCSVHREEEVVHHAQGPLVVVAAHSRHERLVADTEPEDESISVRGRERLRAIRRSHGVARPDVGDTRGDDEG